MIPLLVKQIDMKKIGVYLFCETYPKLYADFIFKLKKLDKDIIKDIVIRMPRKFMTENQKDLVLKILLERRKGILTLNKKEGV